jgi:hypothetical protein
MAHFARVRPLSEFNLCDKRRFYPGSTSFTPHLFRKWRICGLYLDQLAVQFFEGFMAKARTYVTDEAPFLALAHRER